MIVHQSLLLRRNTYRQAGRFVSRFVEHPHSCICHNRVSRMDPTRTFALRNRFVAEMTRRFRRIKEMIYDAVVVKDVFGLEEKKPFQILQILQAYSGLPIRAFAFRTDPAKIEGFMEWLQGEVNKGILDVGKGERRKVVGDVKWADMYIDASYKAGIRRGDIELKKAGKLPPDLLPTSPRYIDASFLSPIHADRVALIYTRLYSELKGITDTLENEISRSLAEGIAEGRNPRQIARIMMNRIEQAGGDLAIRDEKGVVKMRALQRARVLARTEVIRAHHVASINTYREAGIEGVMVQAEWMTAGDDRVCEECESLQGKIFSLDEIEGMIPLHPQCRCVAIPIVDKAGQEKAARAVKEAEEAREAGLPLPPLLPGFPSKIPKIPSLRKVLHVEPVERGPGKIPSGKKTSPSRKAIKVGQPQKLRILPKEYQSLVSGQVVGQRVIGSGVNPSFMVTYEEAGVRTKAITKWEKYEFNQHPAVRDNTDFTTPMREKVAYDLSQELGVNQVPFVEYRNVEMKLQKPLMWRDANVGIGERRVIRKLDGPASVMKKVAEPFSDASGVLPSELNPLEMTKATIFDIVNGAWDRHTGNWLVSPIAGGQGKAIHLIDNGLSFGPYVNFSSAGSKSFFRWGRSTLIGRMEKIAGTKDFVEFANKVRSFKVDDFLAKLPQKISSKISTDEKMALEVRHRIAVDLLNAVQSKSTPLADEISFFVTEGYSHSEYDKQVTALLKEVGLKYKKQLKLLKAEGKES